jgi:hypothetical protein
MAKADKKDVASAKKAVSSKRKSDFAKIAKTPKQGLKQRASQEKAASKIMKNVARDKGNKAQNDILRRGVTGTPPKDTQGRNFKTESGKMVNAPKQSTTDVFKNPAGTYYPVSKRGGNTNSPVKPSVATKTGAKNKMKAQGAKSMLSPTSSALDRAKAKKGK